MKEVVNLLAYFVAVIVLGTLLAPPLWWAGKAVAASGIAPFLAEADFQKYFNRSILIAAIALLWPAVRSLRIRDWRDFGLEPDPRWGRHLLAGFAIAALLVAAMAAVYAGFEVYRWKQTLPWGRLPGLAVSALTVAVLEEALFRGAILGLFRRAMRPAAALFWVTAIFAVVHFLKPDDRIVVSEVHWLSGFQLLPHAFHQFAEPMTLLAGFTTLFVLGWVLGSATLATRSLWMAIGLHAGVVFVKMSFSKFTKREEEFLPWIGKELQIGLVPVAVLVVMGILVWLYLKYANRPRSAHHR